MNAPELHTRSFTSRIADQPRQYYVYTPRGYDPEAQTAWPVIFFLHGDGERGNGLDQLPYVLKHGPLYEAWVQQQDLPFLIVSPQLPMFGRDERLAHLQNRSLASIAPGPGGSPPAREPATIGDKAIIRKPSVSTEERLPPPLPQGWECVEDDLLQILQDVCSDYRVDRQRIYLTGLSYGGFGTWYIAAHHPQLFAAIAPVCGWLRPQYAPAIAQAELPTWVFAGGLDGVITIGNFYLGVEALRKLGHCQLRFTVHEDMEHDVWKRVYASQDFYQWLLNHARSSPPAPA